MKSASPAPGPKRDRRRRVTGWSAAFALVAAGTVGIGPATADASPVALLRPSLGTPSVSLPLTPAGKQARWLIGALAHLPIPTAEVAAHFDQAFLAHVPAPAAAALNAGFVGLHNLRLDSVTTSTPTVLLFVVTVNGKTKWDVRVEVDSKGLISDLHAQPVGSSPPSPSAPLTTAPAMTSVTGVREIPVGVGSPPLKGMLTLPAGKGPFPAVVLVSGSGPNDQNETVGPDHPFLDIALGLAARGIASVRYDKRTLDYPQSIDPRTFTLTDEYVPDALAAIGLLRHEPDVDPHLIFVLGHSQGGTYAPLIAQRAPEVAGVIMLAASCEPLAQALGRQIRYLATLPGTIGANAQAEEPEILAEAAEIGSAATLEKDKPGTVLLGGAGQAYFLSGLHYNEVATARSVPQPFLFLQGDRDYQVTVANDLDVWLKGLKGRQGVTVVQFPKADHLFLDGSGPPTPADYEKPGHVDPKVIAAIASWVDKHRARR